MSLSLMYRRLHFYAGNCWRLASLPWKQMWIRPEEATTIFACSYGENGWQHLRQTLREFDANQQIDWRETTLYRYLTLFRPDSICDLLGPGFENGRLPLFVYPWGTFKRGERYTGKNPLLSRFCGPSSDAFIQEEFDRLINLYRHLKQRGYRPWHYDNSFIEGTFLLRKNGTRRFVVLQGNHRLAVLTHLSPEKVAVRECPGYHRVIREADLTQLPLVVDNTCSKHVAQAVFNLFFEENGRHVCRRFLSLECGGE